MAQTLSSGTLLKALIGKRVYQPIWQVIQVNEHPETKPQLAVTDGLHLGYVTLSLASSHVTYLKNNWKHANSRKNAFEILASYDLPMVKIIDYEFYPATAGSNISIFFVKKLKLMGWEKSTSFVPAILLQPEIQVVLSTGEVTTRQLGGRENLFDLDVRLYEPDSEHFRTSYPLTNGSFDDNCTSNVPAKPTLDPDALTTGSLSVFGPDGLNILRICPDCKRLAYQTENSLTTFRPPTKSLSDCLVELGLLPCEQAPDFCSCSTEDAYTALCREFQNKCMVVNQDSSSDLRSPKVC